MIDLLKIILDIYKNTGFDGVFIIVIVALLVYMFTQKKNSINTSPFKVTELWGLRKKPIKDAPYFTKMEMLLLKVVNDVHLEDEMKDLVFKQLLNVKISIILKKTKEALADDEPLLKMDKEAFETFVEKLFYEAVTAWKREFVESANTADEYEVLNLTLKKFNAKNKEIEDFSLSNYKGICQSDTIYKSNKEKMLAILDMVYAIQHTTIVKAEETFNAINGDFVGLKFKGVECLPHEQNNK